MTSAGWKTVTRSHPCPACGEDDRCGFGRDGLLSCFRASTPPAGFDFLKSSNGATLFRPTNGRHFETRKPATPRPAANVGPDWKADAESARAKMTPQRLSALVATLGVATAALDSVGWAERSDLDRWRAFGAGWNENPPDGAYVFPERDGGGRIVGLSLRAPDGRKGAPRGAKRGLIIPAKIHAKPGTVLIVEGASDVAACETLGLTSVGRPSNSGGADMLAALLDGRDVLVIGENDAKESGDWPGRKGAIGVSRKLATERGEAVAWALPPAESKDVRAWLNARVAAGLDLADTEACKRAGVELLAALQSTARDAKPERKPNQSELIVRLAMEIYELGVSTDGESFAVRRGETSIALPFRGSRDALRAELAREFRRRFNATPKAAALADALNVLAGEAADGERRPVYLRVAEHDGAIIIDLGMRAADGADGCFVKITRDGWTVETSSPVLFRRTALSGPLPIPERGGTIDELRELLNVTADTWPLALGWTVAAFIPSIPHAILMLGGEQGTGKSTTVRILVRCVDPGPALLRSAPRDVEQWAVTAAGSWTVVLDNVSHIATWLSDTLCKAVTGDGFPKRTLYTDSDISVIAFKRVIALTSIDAGALRGDLGERLILADLERIDETLRRTEADLESLFAERHGRIFGALLDVLAATLRELESVRLERMPRMADFARVLAAMDKAIGTDALPRYIAQGRRVAGDVVESDKVGAAIVALLCDGDEWTGTVALLLQKILPENHKPHKDDGWPDTPEALGRRLTRLAKPLRDAGVDVERFKEGKGRTRARMVKLRRIEPSDPSAYGPEAPESGIRADSRRTGADRLTDSAGVNCPPENGHSDPENGKADRSDGSDSISPALTRTDAAGDWGTL
ncbi:MAG TPA: hypothetical protein VNT79_09935 [Phycisphaerae bacterium]|nr:hypothetical protein [Phycisphaerae bacterium]